MYRTTLLRLCNIDREEYIKLFNSIINGNSFVSLNNWPYFLGLADISALTKTRQNRKTKKQKKGRDFVKARRA